MSDVDTSAEAVERLAHHAGKLLLGTTLGEPVPATMRALLAERDAALAEVARLRELLARCAEELRLIRLKDTGALYDVGLRTALSAALAKEPRDD